MDVEVRAFLASLETQPSYSESTRLAYASDLRIFLNYLHERLGRPPALDDFTAEHVSIFLDAERHHGLQTNTLLRRRAALLCFEKFLRQEGFIQGCRISAEPALTGKTISAGAVKPHVQCLSPDHIRQLFGAMEQSHRPLVRRDLAILAMLLETGLSVSALVSLDLSDLDLRARKFHIKGLPKEDFWLPLGAATKPIELYLKEGRLELNPSPDEPALFISQVGVRMSRQSVWQVLRQRGRAANIPVMISPRLLRHTAALRLARAGRSLSEIQSFLGHSNPLSTQALLHRLENLSEAA